MQFRNLRFAEGEIKAHHSECEKEKQACECGQEQGYQALTMVVKLESVSAIHGQKEPESLRKIVVSDSMDTEHEHTYFDSHDGVDILRGENG